MKGGKGGKGGKGSAAAKAAAAKDAAAKIDGDLTLCCRDCQAAFVHTEAEQRFFAQTFNGHAPSRCKACSAAKRARN